jgi:hypothetical protein
LSNYLQKGFPELSFDSDSENINKEIKNDIKNKNFILKSEIFSSFENDKKKKSEKNSHKSSILW